MLFNLFTSLAFPSSLAVVPCFCYSHCYSQRCLLICLHRSVSAPVRLLFYVFVLAVVIVKHKRMFVLAIVVVISVNSRHEQTFTREILIPHNCEEIRH